MTVWGKIKAVVDRVLGEEGRAGNLREDELRLAAAALLVHASEIDGHVDPEERKTLKACSNRALPSMTTSCARS
jgi:uncharacterized tellurite resistance protein B-like protein